MVAINAEALEFQVERQSTFLVGNLTFLEVLVGLHPCVVEHLTQNVSFLDGVDYSYPVVCTRDILDRFYKKMLKEKGFEARKPYGIIGMGLNYAFDKSVPNDCIAVLHLHNEQFNGLLKKRGS